MTYGRLKSAIKLLLIGDNDLPINDDGTTDDDQMAAALEMAYIELASKASALKLLTTNLSTHSIIRQGPGGTYLRMPKLPSSDDDLLDIDNELAPAVARIVASYISRERGELHLREAAKILTAYESKVRVFILEQESEGRIEDGSVQNEIDDIINQIP